MTEGKSMTDFMKSLPAATSDSCSPIGVDGSGNLFKVNRDGFTTATFYPDETFDFILLGESGKDYGVFGTFCLYRKNGHVSIMIQIRSGDSTANWHQHSMIVHPDMRYTNLYNIYGIVKCQYLGKTYNAIRVPQMAIDMKAYFYGVVMHRNDMFGTLVAAADVSDVTVAGTTVLQTSLPSVT